MVPILNIKYNGTYKRKIDPIIRKILGIRTIKSYVSRETNEAWMQIVYNTYEEAVRDKNKLNKEIKHLRIGLKLSIKPLTPMID